MNFAKISPLFKTYSQKMPPLPGGLTLCHVCAALPLRFRKKVSSPREKTLRLPRKLRPDAAVQSAAPATKHRHASCDTLLKYCACHAKRRRYACQETQQNHAICDKIDVRQMILSHFVSAAQRWGLATSSRLRTVADTKTTLSEPNSNLQTSRVKREPFAAHSENTSITTTNHHATTTTTPNQHWHDNMTRPRRWDDGHNSQIPARRVLALCIALGILGVWLSFRPNVWKAFLPLVTVQVSHQLPPFLGGLQGDEVTFNWANKRSLGLVLSRMGIPTVWSTSFICAMKSGIILVLG